MQKEDSIRREKYRINCLRAHHDTLYLSGQLWYPSNDMETNPMINIKIPPNKVITHLEIMCDSMYTRPFYFSVLGYYGNYQKESIWIYTKGNRLVEGKVYTAKYETYRHGKLHGWSVNFDTIQQIIHKSYFIKGTGFQKNYSKHQYYPFRVESKGWLWRGRRVGKWHFYNLNGGLDSVNVYQ